MLLLVGLGNPGADYARHRHNVGFMATDAIADRYGFSATRAKFQSEVREGFLTGPAGRLKAITLKPQTYMNESGRAVGEAVRFFKLEPKDVIVFYDELDIAPGRLKVKAGGGAAGHNGIKSIDAHIGNEFWRVRIGIGHPGDRSKVTGHVLGNFSKSDQEWLSPLLSAIADSAPYLGDGGPRFATHVAQTLAPAKTPSPKREPDDAKRKEIGDKGRENTPKDGRQNAFSEALSKLLGHKSEKDTQ